ncbi:MarR family transcriptional regulator [Rhodococcus erythropolis]|uniref:MarR family winged helix-turn-helix transcriptional regulator n=1 Tax=Rhodococcus erythropolis TaxID=1833 RepID=UPI002949B858|nr:MarR family transcriptional regulator [Rhodococcus erythropolis]MDV6275820.1 MarR family transcriptional regulator [Rhodococcus erythropolis]
MTRSDLGGHFDNLVRFETELWTAIDQRLRTEHDLPLSRFEPMQIIGRLGSCRVFDIAEALAITVGGTSKLVDRIESSGHCRRQSNPADKRSSIIELTPEGKALLRRANATFDDELKRRLGSALTPEALAQFGVTLATLRKANRRLTPGTKGKS